MLVSVLYCTYQQCIFMEINTFWVELNSLRTHGYTLIPAWIGNYIHYKMWCVITYPFPNFNGVTIEVCVRIISNVIPHFVITNPCKNGPQITKHPLCTIELTSNWCDGVRLISNRWWSKGFCYQGDYCNKPISCEKCILISTEINKFILACDLVCDCDNLKNNAC